MSSSHNSPASPKTKCIQQIHAWSVRWQKRLNILFVLSLFLFGVSFFFQHHLPEQRELLPEIKNEPIQEETDRENFSFVYRGSSYDVQPVAEYEMWGLVVSHNNIHSIADIYHDKDSVDLKDLCIIWGENAESDYKKVKFWSNAWTCWWQHDGGVKFFGRDLSNNHILAEDKDIQEQIRNVRIGDQIRVKGMLVNYNPVENGDWKRESSTTRDDTGNGACEVVFAEEIEVLARGETAWQGIHHYSFWGILWSIFGKIFVIFVRIQREKKCIE